jgi:putative ABC transport system permease protein
MAKVLFSLSYSIRTLLREPVFSLIVVLILALDVAANTTIFTVIDHVLLSPLPYRDPSRLVMLWESNHNQPQPAGSHIPAARDNFDSWRKDSHSFQALEAYQQTTYNLTGMRNPEHLDVARSTAGFFTLLGVQPDQGRTFLPEDESSGRNHVAVLSHTFFTNHFQGTSPLGRTLLLNGVPHTIIGVLPRRFHLPNILQGLFEYKPDVWVPLSPISVNDPPLASKRRNLLVYGRLRNNISPSEGAAEMRSLAALHAKDDPALNSGYGINVFPLDFENTDPTLRRALYFLWLAVALVLLLTCINVAGLLVVRTATRQKDMAIMAALGAERGDIVRVAMIPGAALGLMGTLLGIVGAYAGVRLVVALEPGDIHGIERIVLNTNSLMFTALMFAGVVFLVSFLPAWLTSRGNLSNALKQSASSRTTNTPRSVNRSIFVSAEIAIAVVLAIGSTLLIRSFHCLMEVNPGFISQHVLTAHLSLPQQRYASPEDQARFCGLLLQGLRSLSHVESASLIDNMPLYAIRYAPFEIEGRPISQSGEAPTADYANLTPNFFQTMEIPMRSGREFTDEDSQENAGRVVIVNETLAHKLWPRGDAVGSHLRSIDSGRAAWASVVGVVGDFVQFNIDTPPRPEIFWPAKQMRDMTIVVRTKGEPLSTSSAIKEKVWEVDQDQPISDLQTLDQILRHRTSQARFNMWFLALFAGLGILLALIGVYGLISYLVSSLVRDIGIRLALGAKKRQVLFFLLRQTLLFVAIGILLGLGVSLAFHKLMSSLLFGITSVDPTSYVVTPIALFALMFLAVLVPARKATLIDPASILRQQ